MPIQDSANNYHLADEYLFSKVAILPENIYRISTEYGEPKLAAENYVLTLKKVFNSTSLPKFDMTYLGLGKDGHTASLMPQSEVIKTYLTRKNMNEHIQPQIVAQWVDRLKMYRITMLPDLLNNSKRIRFLVVGEDKSHAVAAVLQGEFRPLLYPAQLIQSLDGETAWYLDSSAAQKLME